MQGTRAQGYFNPKRHFGPLKGKKGAADFVLKPFSLDHLTAVVGKALEFQALRDENRRLKDALGGRYQLHNMIGSSKIMEEVFQMVLRAAPTKARSICSRFLPVLREFSTSSHMHPDSLSKSPSGCF